MSQRPRPSRSPQRRRRGARSAPLATLVSLALAAVLLGGTDVGEDLGLPDLLGTRSEPYVVTVTPERLADAREDLASLPVKGRAPRTGYSRDEFGPAWADVDRNGCDTRNDILRRDLTDITTRPGTDGCVVLTGTLVDPYSGDTIDFERGERSAEVQIDHVVALSDAWQKGAQQMTPQERLEFANDPANLLAVDGPLNQQKGDADAATWLPPNRGFRCAYVVLMIEVKADHGLWVTAAEHDAMDRELGRCRTS
ncbi:HNH endonuclease family protein [Cellulomonas bogoriensis]|uniref:Deoxyribonuclease n=1 Tax=Cellulomonas bogoriensis 69B4 = DSM 16987 TaxID=1386082 RepID=A0A0A0BSA3_9CELL|nr:HNH endonuclease family protein [Cellulomonas bogoriensis]KGM11318.1 deoxyribonuclease [Cellulomonas bogoriensis 69B4 = DSM 16987]